MTVDDLFKELRDGIDAVDTELLRLLSRRMELAREVGKIKAEKGLPLFHPGREEAVYERLTKANPGPLTDEALRSIYREIIAASRLLQYSLQVAFLGAEWTFTHLAARSVFGHAARYLPCTDFEEVFDSIQKGKAQMGVIPIENSLQGGVGRCLDLLYQRTVHTVGEVYLEIAHYLCGLGESPETVQRIYGHPQALEQCRRWIQANLKHAAVMECASTVQAAVNASHDPEGAAVCNLYAAHHYGLRSIADRIEDHPGNAIRFFIVANHPTPRSGNDKTSLLFAVPDRPGALHSALEAFSRHGVNLARIESRPNHIFPWQYLFFADIEGHADDPPVKAALQDLGCLVAVMKVLGSYPKSDPNRPIRLEKEKMRGGAS